MTIKQLTSKTSMQSTNKTEINMSRVMRKLTICICEKTYKYRRWLETRNFGFRK